jgi:sec-independent protein translocase protein TatB
MFDFDAGKLIVIGIVALIAIPSKDLPRVLRQIGQATGRVRRMAAEFQSQFMEAMREAEIADLHKDLKSEVDSAFAAVKPDVAFDPLTQAREHIVGAIEAPATPAAPDSPPRPKDEPAGESGA